MSNPSDTESKDVTFREMLDTPSFFEAFRQFVVSEYSEQNVLFYTACNKFRQEGQHQSRPELTAAAKKICTMYIGGSALLEVNVSANETTGLLAAVEKGEVTPDIFEPTKLVIMKLMERDSWKRFEKTPAYKNLRLFSREPTILKPKTAAQQANIKKSSILTKSLQIVTTAAFDKPGGGFFMDFYIELFKQSPESKHLLQHNLAHQTSAFKGALTRLLEELKKENKESTSHQSTVFGSAATDLSKIHLKMGITRSMFDQFGIALVNTLRVYLLLEPDSAEWAAVKHHWTSAFAVITEEILTGMRKESQRTTFFSSKKDEAPVWLQAQLAEYKQYTSLTIMIIEKIGKIKFMEEFYNKFFSLSTVSRTRFRSLAAQHAALWGAIESVVTLLEKPKKMRKTLNKIAKVHSKMDIDFREYMMFVRALRNCFRAALGEAYTEKMDAVWKQFLELLVMFLADPEQQQKGESDMGTRWKDLWDVSDKEGATSPDTSKNSSGEHKEAPVVDVANVKSAIMELPDDPHSTSENSRSSRSESGFTEDIPLELSWFKTVLQGVPDAAILAEIAKLNDRLIYSSSQLKHFSFKEISEIVLPGVAHALAPFTRDRLTFPARRTGRHEHEARSSETRGSERHSECHSTSTSQKSSR